LALVKQLRPYLKKEKTNKKTKAEVGVARVVKHLLSKRGLNPNPITAKKKSSIS
jgi:hypothetical protein